MSKDKSIDLSKYKVRENRICQSLSKYCKCMSVRIIAYVYCRLQREDKTHIYHPLILTKFRALSECQRSVKVDIPGYVNLSKCQSTKYVPSMTGNKKKVSWLLDHLIYHMQTNIPLSYISRSFSHNLTIIIDSRWRP